MAAEEHIVGPQHYKIAGALCLLIPGGWKDPSFDVCYRASYIIPSVLLSIRKEDA